MDWSVWRGRGRMSVGRNAGRELARARAPQRNNKPRACGSVHAHASVCCLFLLPSLKPMHERYHGMCVVTGMAVRAEAGGVARRTAEWQRVAEAQWRAELRTKRAARGRECRERSTRAQKWRACDAWRELCWRAGCAGPGLRANARPPLNSPKRVWRGRGGRRPKRNPPSSPRVRRVLFFTRPALLLQFNS